jgi:hypothetical protein
MLLGLSSILLVPLIVCSKPTQPQPVTFAPLGSSQTTAPNMQRLCQEIDLQKKEGNARYSVEGALARNGSKRAEYVHGVKCHTASENEG